ncbi:MAG: hypothetical protein B6I20_11020 [Bacteroidetes bacterium 4572_117]|nr:MAG: hypothetical protein B6I20_11020 [Bacteroidetes bacterium 4572_117]
MKINKVLKYSGLTLFTIIIITFITGFVMYTKTGAIADNIKIPENSNVTKSQIKQDLFVTGFVLNSFFKDYVSSLGLLGNEKVLDFGSGTGAEARYLAEILSEKGGQLTCLDVSETWIKVSKEKLKNYNNIEYLCGYITEMEIKENSYDNIIVHYVLHVIDKKQRASYVEKFNKILKNGGKIFIREPQGHKGGITPKEIHDLMINNGFNELKSEQNKYFIAGFVTETIYQKP